MSRRCMHCARDDRAPAPDALYCEECRVILIQAGRTELALPGELSAGGRFTPYLELDRSGRCESCGRQPCICAHLVEPGWIARLEREVVEHYGK